MNKPFKIWIEDKKTLNKVLAKMTKSDLKDWMIVKTRIGNIYIVDKTHDILVSTDGWMQLDQYHNDLLCFADSAFDIVAVYKVTEPFAVRFYMNGTLDTPFDNNFKCLQTIWKREENPTEMTISEIEEKLGIKNLKLVKEKEDE